jgi:rare lipoprotein A
VTKDKVRENGVDSSMQKRFSIVFSGIHLERIPALLWRKTYFIKAIMILLILLFALTCTTTNGTRRQMRGDSVSKAAFELSPRSAQVFYGKASYYGDEFHGRKTASGETFDMYKLSAAHRTFPFGTLLRVTNLKNNKEVDLKVNDRGPFVDDRILDLSYGAAKELDSVMDGVIDVKIEVLYFAEQND